MTDKLTHPPAFRPARRGVIGLLLVVLGVVATLASAPPAQADVYQSSFTVYDRAGDARPRFDIRKVTVSDNARRIYVRVHYRNLWDNDGTNTRVSLEIRGQDHVVVVKYKYLFGMNYDGTYSKWCRSGSSRVITVHKPARDFLTMSFGKRCIGGSTLRVAQAATSRSSFGKPVDAVSNKRKWLRY